MFQHLTSFLPKNDQCIRNKENLQFNTANNRLNEWINPFAPEPPKWIHIPSSTWDVIHLNSQGQLLCHLTWAGWRDLSNHTRISTLKWRGPEKEAKTMYYWPKNFLKNLVLTRKYEFSAYPNFESSYFVSGSEDSNQ